MPIWCVSSGCDNSLCIIIKQFYNMKQCFILPSQILKNIFSSQSSQICIKKCVYLFSNQTFSMQCISRIKSTDYFRSIIFIFIYLAPSNIIFLHSTVVVKTKPRPNQDQDQSVLRHWIKTKTTWALKYPHLLPVLIK